MPFSQLERAVRAEQRCLRNHLMSIDHDSQYVDLVRGLFPSLPLVANLRNGLWYSDKFDSSCYFKSTDGHQGFEAFSTQRLNLDFAQLVLRRGGAIVVDSTTGGKLLPDSMRATIPLWACVLNTLIFGSNDAWCTEYLRVPPGTSPIQKAELGTRVQALMDAPDFVRYAGLIRAELQAEGAGRGPLRLLWAYVGSDGCVGWLGEDEGESEGEDQCCLEEVLAAVSAGTRLPYTPVVLLSCSGPVDPAAWRATHSWSHLQGAGDDQEHWSCGLSPALFWSHREALLRCADPVLLNHLVTELVHAPQNELQSKHDAVRAAAVRIRGTTLLACGAEKSQWATEGPAPRAVIRLLKAASPPVCRDGSPPELALFLSSLKQDRQYMQRQWGGELWPLCRAFAAHPLAEAEAGPLLVLVDADWGAAAILCAALVLEFFPHLAMAAEEEKEAAHARTSTARVSKQSVLYVLALLQASDPRLLSPRHTTKTLLLSVLNGYIG